MRNKLMRGTAILCLIALLAAITGCSSNNSLAGNSQPEPSSLAFTVMADQDNEFVFVTPDGVRHDRAWLAETSSALDGDETAISFGVGQNGQQTDRMQDTIGSYFYKIAIDPASYVSCFKRNVRHFNLIIRDVRTNTLLLDIHLAGWWDNGPQFGMYQSAGNKTCARTTGNFTKIRQAIQDVLSRMTPLPYWIYMPLAYTVAVIAVGSLALAW